MQSFSRDFPFLSSSCSFFNASSFTVSCFASCAFSTITARMRFMTHRLTDTSAAAKKTLVIGLYSMMGTVSVPHESPARICCENVSMDCCTDSKARGQRTQSATSTQ